MIVTGELVRCFFVGTPDAPEPFDLTFSRVPSIGERVIYRESEWVVDKVTWAQEGAFITLSYAP